MPDIQSCKFDLAWIGPCKKETSGRFCDDHAKEKCWCGEQAVRQCDVAGSFVCGSPICGDHQCKNVARGLTGSDGNPHSERGQEQYEKWRRRANA